MFCKENVSSFSLLLLLASFLGCKEQWTQKFTKKAQSGGSVGLFELRIQLKLLGPAPQQTSKALPVYSSVSGGSLAGAVTVAVGLYQRAEELNSSNHSANSFKAQSTFQ